MNRQQRRAVQRKQARVPMVRLGLLTIPEAEVLTEALDAYAVALEEEVDPTSEQVWAIGRAKVIRDMLQASIDGRPNYDQSANREPA